jgi:Protein of unknown function (DUF2867)
MSFANVKASDLPTESLLHERIVPEDFLDCYSVFSDVSPRRAAEIITDFPKWARVLLVVRRWVTSPFGLSNEGPAASDKIGVFPVETENNQELIAGFDDRHLNFRISVLSREGQVFLATWVHPHNLGGRFYLKLIMPFHVLIVRDALSRVSAFFE